MEKLKELGWAEELSFIAPSYTSLTEYNPVKEPRDLTERSKCNEQRPRFSAHDVLILVWENIKVGVVEHMKSIKQRRAERERPSLLKRRSESFATAYRRWHQTQMDKSALPRPIDLITRRPEIRALIDEGDDVHVSVGDFEDLSKHFALWAAEWAMDCKQQLREIVLTSPEFKDKIPDGVDPLALASVAFTCTYCDRSSLCHVDGEVPALYPDILQHDCLWKPVSIHSRKGRDPLERATLAVSEQPGFVWTHGPWSSKPLRIGVWHRRLVMIIRMCGKDPTSVTSEEMDGVDTRFYCQTCEERSGWKNRRVFKWWNTVSSSGQPSKSTPHDVDGCSASSLQEPRLPELNPRV